ncbi:MAG TPA: hypothetical protein VKE74_13560 [Gemmataceae bacterium]|nr:hypothetical protein [Gemmataceae bacterium]
MTRFLFAVGSLLTFAVSQSPAGYYVVRVVLEGGGNDPAAAAPGTGAMPYPMAGSPMFSGRPPGPIGGPGPMSGYPPTGAPLGRPGPGVVQPPIGEGPGVIPGAQPAATTIDPTRSVVVVVPFTKPYSRQSFYLPKKGAYAGPPYWDYVLNHPRGRTNLFHDGATFQVYANFQNTPEVKTLDGPPGTRTYTIAIERKYEAWTKTAQDPQALCDLIVEALENGMVPQAVDWSDKLLVLVDQKKPQTTQQVTRFVQAYREVQGPMKSRPVASKEGENWKQMFDAVNDYAGANTRTQGHYTLVYWDADEEEIALRFTRLEDNFRAFFLWHALQGIVLKVPTRPLVAVVLREARVFHPIREDFGRPFLVCDDSFVVAQSNVLVMSPERTDSVGQSFRRSNHLNVFQGGLSRKALLNGDGPKLIDATPMNPIGPGGQPPIGEGGAQPPPVGPGGMPPMNPMNQTGKTKDDVARAMTLAMVERYDSDATELGAVSCDGCRQLMSATGMFPDHVDLPLWLSSGAGSFFHRPRDPVYTSGNDNKATMGLALTTGYGRPNYAMQFHFRQMDQKKELNQNPAVLLRNVVTDAYFFAAPTGKDLDNPAALPKEDRAEEQKRLEALAIKARATAWALYYYLAKNRPTELMAFFDELGRMPRDLSLDPNTKMLAFARVFRLITPAGELDEAAMATFAKGWLDSVRFVPESWVNIEVTTPAAAIGGAPGAPVGPGALPGPGRPRGPGD